MRSYRRALRVAIRSQANAYGFTLIIWGTGALVIDQLGMPKPVDVFCYIGGALSAATILIAGAFDLPSALDADDPPLRATSAVHLVSVPVAICAGWSSTLAIQGWAGYFLAGLVAVLLYEILLSVEIALSLVHHN